MDAPQSLDALFTNRLFRIPDYQRGYAWREEHLRAFWEDLISLPDKRSHYTGVLTLKAAGKPPTTAPESWLIDGYSFALYDVVDGQQRLTTCVICIHALLKVLRALPENQAVSSNAIFLADGLSLASVEERFLFVKKPPHLMLRTYKFGYSSDNPSDRYLRHSVFAEPDPGLITETFYTLNLGSALEFFASQIASWHCRLGMNGLRDIYNRLTKRLLFNLYIIEDEFDVFVAFESMNNRGKPLSDLEKLKNRLIYLATLYPEQTLGRDECQLLRESVNAGWKEIYHQLGREPTHPLSDDDFLRAHWIMYFRYSRETGRDYIRFLLETEFIPQRVHRQTVSAVSLQTVNELRDAQGETDDDAIDPPSLPPPIAFQSLSPAAILDYVASLKSSAVHWFTTFFPEKSATLTAEEKAALARLNRIGMGYFRPLIMAGVKKNCTPTERVQLFDAVERFIFLGFRMGWAQSNYGSSVFPRAAKTLDSGGNVQAVIDSIDNQLAGLFHEDGTMKIHAFHALMEKRFNDGPGYYGWSGLRYFLYEYELSRFADSRQLKCGWDDLLNSKRDTISIEHIYPQTSTPEWDVAFGHLDENARLACGGSIGNLLLLSKSINSSLQNDPFAAKKNPRYNDGGQKIRNGYSDGSHSEIEVAEQTDWTPAQIRTRGLKLLRFLETRWKVRFGDKDRETLLFMPAIESAASAQLSEAPLRATPATFPSN